MKNSILVAKGKVESLRMTGEQNEDEIDDLRNAVKCSRTNVQEGLMLKT